MIILIGLLLTYFMQLISIAKQKSFCEDSEKTNSFCIFGKYLAYHEKSFRVPPVVRVLQVGNPCFRQSMNIDQIVFYAHKFSFLLPQKVLVILPMQNYTWCCSLVIKKQLQRAVKKSNLYYTRGQSRSSRPPKPPIGGGPHCQKGPQIVLKDPKLHQFKNKVLLGESR